jgi:hypothetical protein
MIIGVDAMNHKQRSAMVALKYRHDRICVVALQPIRAGEEVYTNYGNRGNRRLLSSYGFAVPQNPDDYYPVCCAQGPRTHIKHVCCVFEPRAHRAPTNRQVCFSFADADHALGRSKRAMLERCSLPHNCGGVAGTGAEGAEAHARLGRATFHIGGGHGDGALQTVVGPLPLVRAVVDAGGGEADGDGSGGEEEHGASGLHYVLLAMAVAMVQHAPDGSVPSAGEMEAALEEVEDGDVATALCGELEGALGRLEDTIAQNKARGEATCDQPTSDNWHRVFAEM